MSDPSELVECDSHGRAIATFACIHLATSIHSGFHHSIKNPRDRWPDAWCSDCEIASSGGNWNETNEAIADIQVLCLSCYELARQRNEMTQPARVAYLDAVLRGVDSLRAAQARLDHEHGLFVGRPHWRWVQESATLTFSWPDERTLVSNVAFIGSVGARKPTWMWSWANESALPVVSRRARELRLLTKKRGWPAFDIPSWPADEETAWEISAIACRELGGIGAYRTQDDGGTVYMVLLDMQAGR
jgi:hypothetical protein